MRAFCCSSLGSLMFFPNEIFLLFFFRFADVFPQRVHFVVIGKTSANLKKNSKILSLWKNISKPKEEQKNDLIGEKHQRA
jgi:hypothetical protein